ncbi:hypothetical protein DPEC_G00094420 [Dallia pectoralis]|uniref:Uncharacterized protein n=1 Tax=Dallia pectoralis TaxID=75939 RepID=A0ACC2H201_DALPE|nr:hypothetical protein DPEC_G00094420 [Dallia pectoralis]
MIGLKPVVLGLVLLICSNTCHCDGRETSAAPTVLRNTKNLLRRIAELVEGVEDHREDGHREDHREDGHREDGHRENHREEDHREDHREEDHREDHREDGPWEDHREDGHGEDGHRQDHREDHRENGHGEDGDREKRRSPINLKTDPRDPIIEIFPRDLRKKEKFIKHLTEMFSVPQALSTSVPNAGSMYTDYITIPEDAQYLHDEVKPELFTEMSR